ncbi:unnamed protein product, partial [Discosporangium mesarthrocarpum]
RSLKEESLRDVLDDSDDDDENCNVKDNKKSPTSTTVGTSENTTPTALTAGAAAEAVQPNLHPTCPRPQGHHKEPRELGHCYVARFPPDLLLQCAEYLTFSPRPLCRAREVCWGWLVLFDGPGAGERLWRPVFGALSATGAISGGGGALGKGRRLKAYNLSGGLPGSGRGGTAVGQGTRRGISPPLRPPSATNPATTDAAGAASAADFPTGAGMATVERVRVCGACGLLQREGYLGSGCEMCLSSLMLTQTREEGERVTPRLAYMRVELSGPGEERPLTTSLSSPGGRDGRYAPAQGGACWLRSSPRAEHGADPAAAAAAGGLGVGVGVGVGGNDREVPVDGGEAWGSSGCGGGGRVQPLDWHFLVKRLTVEKRLAGQWGSLHRGWEWLQADLQARFRRRMIGSTSNNTPAPSTPLRQSTHPTPATHASRQGKVQGQKEEEVGKNHPPQETPPPLAQPSWTQRQPSPPRCLAEGGERGALEEVEPDPTVARVFRKLAHKRWVALYDSLKALFSLQAEEVAREVVRAVASEEQALANAGPSPGPSPSPAPAFLCLGGGKRCGGGAGKVAGTKTLLGFLQGCVSAWVVYRDWCEEVDMYGELLNERISAERLRTAGAGCGRGDNTPFVRDTALLSFRQSFALNAQICSALREVISLGTADLSRQSSSFTSLPHSRKGKGKGFQQQEEEEEEEVGGGGAEDMLFTDQELVEDIRAVHFSVQSFSCGSSSGSGSSSGGGGSSGGGARGRKHRRVAGVGGMVGVRTDPGESACAVSKSAMGGGSYYDWFLSKLERRTEGEEAMLVGDDSSFWEDDIGRGGEGGIKGEGEEEGSLQKLLEQVREMVEELDVPDDSLSKDRNTQG